MAFLAVYCFENLAFFNPVQECGVVPIVFENIREKLKSNNLSIQQIGVDINLEYFQLKF
jgi:hypothetical protein